MSDGHDDGQASPQRRVGAVVLNYRNWPEVADTLRCLLEQTVDLDLIVVDNASGDGSADHLERAFPGVRVERLSRNRGFGPGMNHGASLLGDVDQIFFASHEVILEPSALEHLVAAVRDGASAAGPRIMHLGSETTFSTGGGLRSDGGTFHHVEPVSDVEWLDGGALLVDRGAFQSVGGFDEGYFLYYEDVELGVRLSEAGGRLISVEGALAWARPTPTLPWLLLRRNQLRFVARNLGRRSLLTVMATRLRTGAARLWSGDVGGAVGVVAPVVAFVAQIPPGVLHRLSLLSQGALTRRRSGTATTAPG